MKAAQITPERAPFAPQFPQHLPAGLVRAGVRRGFPLEPLRGVGHWHCPGACADTRTRGSAAAAPPAASADPGEAPAPAVSQPYLAAVPGPAPAAAACACGDSPAAPLPCVSGASLPLLPLVPPPLLLGIQQDRDVSRFLEFQLLLVTEITLCTVPCLTLKGSPLCSSSTAPVWGHSLHLTATLPSPSGQAGHPVGEAAQHGTGTTRSPDDPPGWAMLLHGHRVLPRGRKWVTPAPYPVQLSLLLPSRLPRLFSAQPLCGSGAPCSDQVPPGLPLCPQSLQLLSGGQSCGRTLFPGYFSAEDRHLVDQGEVAGLRLLGLKAPLSMRKFSWAMAEPAQLL